MKKTLQYFLILLTLTLSSCHVGRFFVWNFADARDHQKFQKIDIQKEGDSFTFTYAHKSGKLKLPQFINKGKKKYEFEKALQKSGTVAFIIIKNDSTLYENYFQNRTKESQHPSFSVAKSVTSMLVGIAIDEGEIKSVKEPITNYLSELPQGKGFEKITIEHLLDMRSGIRFDEGYFNPFGNVAKYYYGRNMKKYIKKLKIQRASDQKFQYKSVNTQLLALIVENAVQKPIVKYLEEKIWKPLGMEYDASWSIDSKKHQTIKAFCCLNARARDFAKLGRLYLNKGNWNGTQIVSEKWVKQSTTFDKVKNSLRYSYQWWHNRQYQYKKEGLTLPEVYTEKEYTVQKDGKTSKQTFIVSPYPDFFAEGILGQYIYVHPQKKIIIVRLGKRYGGVKWERLFKQIAEVN